ncbi:MAG: hypothetical protein CMB75_01380 [Euryarchaeota archaeon]|nr:hypothetical protein [Euryarchaeota archaeon]|tara:strand:- start:21658 stop:23667 length:2010 start_codon:yes stop_codon:yes gene_type:complete
MNTLIAIPGVGESLSRRLIEELGDEEEVLRIIKNKDVASLSKIEGLSTSRAVRIINEFGGDGKSIALTSDAQKLHDRLLNDIESHISSSPAKKRLGVLQPMGVGSISEIENRRKLVSEAISFVATAPSSVIEWDKGSRGVKSLKSHVGKVDRVIVVPDSASAQQIKNIEKFARLVVRGKNETWKDYEGLPRVTWIGPYAPDQMPPGWVFCKINDDFRSMIPEISLQWIENNRSSLESLVDLSNIALGADSLSERIRDAVDGLDDLGWLLKNEIFGADIEILRDGLWSEIKAIEGSVDDSIVSSTSEASLSLDGSEMLAYYSDANRLQHRLRGVVSDSISESLELGRQKLSDYLEISGISIPVNCFESEYPCSFSRVTIELIEQELDSMISNFEIEGAMVRAEKASLLVDKAQDSISEIIDIDMWIGIAKWARYRKCVLPDIKPDVEPSCYFSGFRHPLLGVDPIPIRYGFGNLPEPCPEGSIVLLTGANSGGKTSLIEGIASILLLSHAGLPVPADQAVVSLADEIHLLAKVTGTQSAGALERTLMGLSRIVISSKKKFILADELEAITEPEAASGILAGLLDAAASNPLISVVMVTHIGASIRKKMIADARIDGIEAKGLDEQMELIVDRVPRIGIPARSTPELILRRLEARTNGSESDLFRSIIERL